MKLEPVEITGLTTSINACNCELRRDIHVFINYVMEYEVKRTYRNNTLPKADFMKLAKLVSDPEAVNDVKSSGSSGWIEYIDKLALNMGFVNYDTEGQYMGYTSSEPSFPDNYIKVNTDKYLHFLEATPDKQESFILKVMLDDYKDCKNEFFSRNILGMLEVFDRRGCATGVVPTLNFASIRKFLLELLALFKSGVWYSVESLIKYLKQSHPYFLIPKDFKVKNKYDERERYGNFTERKGNEWKYSPINEKDPDAFERVEGRYVERFLEGIPLVMGYVDTAYAEDYASGLHPSIGHIRAFRVRDRLANVMKGAISEPKVWIQPNFEVYIESDLYPAQILSKLAPLTDVVKEDQVIILKLKKEKVAASAARDKAPDIVSLLQSVSSRELPQNVLTELKAWNSHAEMFTLYEGFSLLEEARALPEADEYTLKRISPNIRLIHSADKLFSRLEDAGWVPLSANHQDSALVQLPEDACTVFRRKSAMPISRSPKKAILSRKTNIVHYFPSEELYEIFVRKLIEAKCTFEVNKAGLSIIVSPKSDALIKEIIKELRKDYHISIEDME
jgi:hypothetical protein